jgi:hypothetical protein
MNLSFVVNNLGNSEQNYEMIKLANSIATSSNMIVPNIFYHNIVPPVMPLACLNMNISGLSGMTGKTISFDLESAQTVIATGSTTENWLYLWDLPWLYSILNYPLCLELLSRFKIVVRSNSHKDNAENFTGRKDIIVAENMDKLYSCLI